MSRKWLSLFKIVMGITKWVISILERVI